MPPGRGVRRAGVAVGCPFPPPYKAKQTPGRPGNAKWPHRFAGGMYAAPTHGPNAVAMQKRQSKANVRGPPRQFSNPVARRATPQFFIFIF